MELAVIKENPLLPKTKVSSELHQINFTPKLRYFAVGPSTRIVKCPLCNTRCESIENELSNLKELVNGILCCFSCCFPIFCASFIYIVITKMTKRKRHICSTCSAQLGFYRCPS